MGSHRDLGVDAVCCLLHNLIPGGSAWQWIRLLGRHVENGGRATIFAPLGALAEPARAAGIEVVDTSWEANGGGRRRDLWTSVGRHEAAIVHWDHQVMDAFAPALEACGRAALVLHQAPHALQRWFGPEAVASARIVLDEALAEENAIVLVRGEAHRRRVAAAFDIPPDELRALPASIPLSRFPFRPVMAPPGEVLALTRLSPEKAPIVRLAVELVRARLASGRQCRLTIAGEGAWRPDALALCERRLPRETWRVEAPPQDPIARLAGASLIVAQGLTTLEAAALGRRVIVARAVGEDGAGGAVLTADSYDEAAQDPFGKPSLVVDPDRLWAEILSVEEDDLVAVRRLVEERNALEVASRALGQALQETGPLPNRRDRLLARLRRQPG